MTNRPYPDSQQPRRRRSDKHKSSSESGAVPQDTRRPSFQPDSDRAPLPLNAYEPPQSGLPPRREGPLVYDFDRYPPQTQLQPQTNGDIEPDDYPRKRWPLVLLILLILLLAISAVLYFLVPKDDKGVLGIIRRPLAGVVDKVLGIADTAQPNLIKFESAAPFGVTGVRNVFTFTTDTAVDSVRLRDENGNVISGVTMAENPPDNTLWTVTVVFDEPFEGPVFGSMSKGESWISGGKSVQLNISSPTPPPTPTPTAIPTNAPTPTFAPELGANNAAAGVIMDDALTSAPDTVFTAPPFIAPVSITADANANAAVQTASPQVETPPVIVTQPPVETPVPFTILAQQTEVPLEELPAADMTQLSELPDDISVEPIAPIAPIEPVDLTEPPAATFTPMPLLTAQAADDAAPSKLEIKDTAFLSGKKQSEFAREEALAMPQPEAYTTYDGGVFTFRNDNFRGNAAFGTVDVQIPQLSVAWQTELGNMRTDDSGRLYGVGWTGQPVIIKWSKELRLAMNITDEKKQVSPLKEVIFSGQDGKVYFLDLDDGVMSRDPINVGYPLKGSVSVDPQGQPIIAFGQGISKVGGKTGPIGFYIYSLLDQKELYFLNGRRTDKQDQYSTNGAFDGTALFERSSDHLVVGGENGLLYTVKLNTQFDYANPENMSIAITPEISYLMTKGKQENTTVSLESSAAMYSNYAFVADKQGYVRCVDTTTMQTVWAFDAGDNTDATPALDFSKDGSLSLYTGTTVFARQQRAKQATIRSLNAMTGAENWAYTVACSYSKDERAGVKASPVVGKESIADLVIFTVNKVEEGGSAIVALNKQTGAEFWKHRFTSEATSSPVAVYNDAGNAWIIQGDESGRLTMLEGLTGTVATTLELGGKIEGSPAVYRDMLVIGTSSDTPYMYGIRIQ